MNKQRLQKLAGILTEAKYAGLPEMPIGNPNNAAAVIPVFISAKQVNDIVEWINAYSIEDEIEEGEMSPVTVQEVLSNKKMFKVIIYDWLKDSISAGSDYEEYWNGDGWHSSDIEEARK